MNNIWLQLTVFTLLLWICYEVWRKMLRVLHQIKVEYKRLRKQRKELEDLFKVTEEELLREEKDEIE